MTTITIDQDIKLNKTHFATAEDVLQFLVDLYDNDWTVESSKNKQAYKKSIEGKNKGYSLASAKEMCNV